MRMFTGPYLFGASFVCRHWFRPSVSTEVMWNENAWGDLAICRAVEAWDNGKRGGT